jgi:CBS domain-containing protein
MSQVAEFMTKEVQSIAPDRNLREATQLMQTLEVGALPVCAGTRLVGMVTDRDIVVRGLALGLNPDEARVADVMSSSVHCCSIEQDAQEVMRLMGDHQVRRLPVVDANHGLVGIVSLGDLALRQRADTDTALRDISAHTPEDPS